jgi:hypothetical protein
MEDPEACRLLVQLIANQMKKTYVAWNRSEVTNEQILKDIWDISDGKINIAPGSIRILDIPDNSNSSSRENQPVRSNQRTKKKRISGAERK